MTPKLDEKNLRKKLIRLYEIYLLGEDITSQAKTYFQNYSGAQMFLDKEINEAIGYLENIGWDLEPQDNVVREIFENLKEQE